MKKEHYYKEQKKIRQRSKDHVNSIYESDENNIEEEPKDLEENNIIQEDKNITKQRCCNIF